MEALTRGYITTIFFFKYLYSVKFLIFSHLFIHSFTVVGHIDWRAVTVES